MYLKTYVWLLFFSFSFLTRASFPPTDNQEVTKTENHCVPNSASQEFFDPENNKPDSLKYFPAWLSKMRKNKEYYNKRCLDKFKRHQQLYFLDVRANVENKDFLLLHAVNFLQTDEVAALIQEGADTNLRVWFNHIPYFKLADYNKALLKEAIARYDDCKNSWAAQFNGKLIKLHYEIEERKRIDTLFTCAAQ